MDPKMSEPGLDCVHVALGGVRGCQVANGSTREQWEVVTTCQSAVFRRPTPHPPTIPAFTLVFQAMHLVGWSSRQALPHPLRGIRASATRTRTSRHGWQWWAAQPAPYPTRPLPQPPPLALHRQPPIPRTAQKLLSNFLHHEVAGEGLLTLGPTRMGQGMLVPQPQPPQPPQPPQSPLPRSHRHLCPLPPSSTRLLLIPQRVRPAHL